MLHLDRTPTMCVFFLLSLFERAGREQLPMSQWMVALSEHGVIDSSDSEL
jgi:hypothetical protein